MGKPPIKLDYTGYERTTVSDYYMAVSSIQSAELASWHKVNAKQVSIAGIKGDFFYTEGVDETEHGVSDYVTISEALTGAKVATDFTLENAIRILKNNFRQHGTTGWEMMVKRLDNNVSPRYKKL